MEIHLKTINNSVVKPLKIEKDNRPEQGGHIMPYCSNIYLVAPTASGKTTTLAKILKEICVRNRTIIVAFVSSIYNDENWLAIRKWALKNNIGFIAHDSIFKNKVNLLDAYVKDFEAEAMERDRRQMEREMKRKKVPEYGPYDHEIEDSDDEEEKDNYPKKYAKYVFVFDDLANEVRTTEFETLLKRARHYGISTVTSSQDLKDLRPATCNQIRTWILFGNIPPERLKKIYEYLSIKIPFEEFLAMYEYATKDKYNFFYVRPRDLIFRKNFNKNFFKNLSEENI